MDRNYVVSDVIKCIDDNKNTIQPNLNQPMVMHKNKIKCDYNKTNKIRSGRKVYKIGDVIYE